MPIVARGHNFPCAFQSIIFLAEITAKFLKHPSKPPMSMYSNFWTLKSTGLQDRIDHSSLCLFCCQVWASQSKSVAHWLHLYAWLEHPSKHILSHRESDIVCYYVSFPIARTTHFFGKVKKKKFRITHKEASTLVYKQTILSYWHQIVLDYQRYFVFVAFLDIL